MMLSKKSPPMGKNHRRLQRPYAKADITIEDQQREQRKLLNAGKAFQGYDRSNLNIIAMSFEHKCFSEARNREEYIAKIRSKLVEWKYVPEDDAEENGPLKLKLAPNPPTPQQQQQHQEEQLAVPLSSQLQAINNRQQHQKPNASHSRTNHQRHHSGPILTSHAITNGSPVPSPSSDHNPSSPSSQPYSPKQRPFFSSGTLMRSSTLQAPFQPHLSHQDQTKQIQFHLRNNEDRQDDLPQSQVSPVRNGRRPSTSYQLSSPQRSPHQSPQQNQGKSPQSQPMSHSTTTISTTSSASSTEGGFMDYFDPRFLENINLNDPGVRALWVTTVWEFFQSGGQWTGYNFKAPQNFQVRSGTAGTISSLYAAARNGTISEMETTDTPKANGDANYVRRQLGGTLPSRPVVAHKEPSGRRRAGQDEAVNMNTEGQWMSSMDVIDVGMSNMDGVLNGDMDMAPMAPMSPATFEKWLMQ